MYHYKARVYSPTLGRFLQTDPIGYGDGMNMYAYVHNNPTNRRDPLGLTDPECGGNPCPVVTGCGQGRVMVRGVCVESNFDFVPPPTGGTPGLPRPPICRGVSRVGNNVTITTPVEFHDGNYPQRVPDVSTPLSSPGVANYYINIFNTGRFNGQFGAYTVDVNMSRGSGGIIAFVGDTVASGIMGGASDYISGVMWLHTPTAQPAYDALLADHELGHEFGNPHSQELPGYTPGQAPNLMDRFPYGSPLPSHIETLLDICGLN